MGRIPNNARASLASLTTLVSIAEEMQAENRTLRHKVAKLNTTVLQLRGELAVLTDLTDAAPIKDDGRGTSVGPQTTKETTPSLSSTVTYLMERLKSASLDWGKICGPKPHNAAQKELDAAIESILAIDLPWQIAQLEQDKHALTNVCERMRKQIRAAEEKYWSLCNRSLASMLSEIGQRTSDDLTMAKTFVGAQLLHPSLIGTIADMLAVARQEGRRSAERQMWTDPIGTGTDAAAVQAESTGEARSGATPRVPVIQAAETKASDDPRARSVQLPPPGSAVPISERDNDYALIHQWATTAEPDNPSLLDQLTNIACSAGDTGLKDPTGDPEFVKCREEVLNSLADMFAHQRRACTQDMHARSSITIQELKSTIQELKSTISELVEVLPVIQRDGIRFGKCWFAWMVFRLNGKIISANLQEWAERVEELVKKHGSKT